jgi:hypothetical protein
MKTAITLTPTKSQYSASTQFTVNKSLPQGISINAETGVISGTSTGPSETTGLIVTATGSWGSFSSSPFKLSLTVGTPFKIWGTTFYGNVRGDWYYTMRPDDVRIADITLLDVNGNALTPEMAYSYYNGFNTQSAWDDNGATVLTDGIGSGLFQHFTQKVIATRVRVRMVGTDLDLTHVHFCKSDTAGWGSGYHSRCTAQPVALPKPASGGLLYAPGEIVEMDLPNF